MKKIFTMMIAAVLLISSTTTAFAAGIGNYSVQDPGTSDTSQNNNNVTVYGYIGKDATVIPGPGGGEPTVKNINVTIPAQMVWAAYEDDFSTSTHSAPITSANHYITCNADSADVKVKVLSFTQTNAATAVLPSTATLDLGLGVTGETGVPTVANVADLFSLGGGVQIAALKPNEKVKVLVTGSYADSTDAFPTTAIQPIYTMVLRLDAD